MKKVLMTLCLFTISACVLACVNDPTLSDELPESWATDTDTQTETVVEVSTDTETVVDTQTSTEEG